MSKTITTLFTCAGGADEGARQAGLEGLNGFEIDPKPAAIAQANGHPVTVADICDVDFSQYEAPWWLHASPVCVRASVANLSKKRGEADIDIRTAEATARAIRTWKPEIVSIENVVGYTSFEAYNILIRELGYHYSLLAQNVNCWEYGVPQTRRRLILVARRSTPPKMPAPSGPAVWGTPETLARLRTYPTTSLGGAPAKKLLADPPKETVLVNRQFGGRFIPADRPAMTIASDHYRPSVWLGDEQRLVRMELSDVAALQTFPANYKWPGPETAALDAIGNALPPELMRRIVEANL